MAHDDIFSALADPTRRRLLEALREESRSVGSLVEALGVSQPTVSKHLKVLREAGLVTMRADGQRRYYALEAATFGGAAGVAAGLRSAAGSAAVSLVPERYDDPHGRVA